MLLTLFKASKEQTLYLKSQLTSSFPQTFSDSINMSWASCKFKVNLGLMFEKTACQCDKTLRVFSAFMSTCKCNF